MSLFSSIRMAGNTLQTTEIGLQVVGQNIANAGTPGYIREEVILKPAPTQRQGGLLLGMGVQVEAVVQKLDHFLEDRLRGAVSDRAAGDALESAYLELETLMGELSDTDLSTQLNTFFASIAEVLNQPEDVSIRNLAVLQGDAVASRIRTLATRVQGLQSDVNDQILGMGGDINRLATQIRDLNVRIAATEGGDITNSDAVGLRDQRQQALENLAELIDIRVVEQPSGGVVVYTGGEFLVSEGTVRPVETVLAGDSESGVANIHYVDTDAPISPQSGKLRGLLEARDEVLTTFRERLDDFASALATEFNKIYASGQGLHGYGELTSEYGARDVNAPLNAAGLPFPPKNGSFQVIVRNRTTGEENRHDVRVDLNGVGQETSLTTLVASLDGIRGLDAEITSGNRLALTSSAADQEFSFANDTSGVLAALGLNVFFTGTNAGSLSVSGYVTDDPAKFAASQGGPGADTENAVRLADLMDRPIADRNGDTLAVIYSRFADSTIQSTAAARATAEGSRVFEETLRGQKAATSGVSIDEEAVRLIAYQRAFQATARYISTLSELFNILVNI